ncbi:hypothetical protein GQX73_g10929 [Xylaria multiplex]|uniref:Uncharacterized protein n=1 Tax=Xylaria multiplex TaxID=323545 RepID=A0A7C8IKD9_9PEZI|nr:hypothetical protein GQX73_g10929 [Xylaria multiplex]
MSTSPTKAEANTAALPQQNDAEAKEVLDLLKPSQQSSQPDSSQESPLGALQNLFEKQDASPTMRKTWLGILGNGNTPKSRFKPKVQGVHEKLIGEYHAHERVIEEDAVILKSLQNYQNDELKYLFAHGHEGFTILHSILDPEAYDPDRAFKFDCLKPLIRFLIRLNPELPAAKATGGKGTPIFMALNRDGFSASDKGEIIKFLCDKHDGGLGSRAAIESLGQIVYYDDGSGSSYRTHAIRKAIESSDFEISECQR